MIESRPCGNIKINRFFICWFIYFFSFFILAANIRYSHYVFTLFLVFASLINNNFRIRYSSNVLKVVVWYVFFVIWLFASWFWADGETSEQKIIVVSSLESMIMLICLMNDGINRERGLSIVSSYLSAVLVLGVFYYLLSPSDTWGSTEMGAKLGIWRNAAGYYFSFASFCAFFMYTKFRNGIIFLFIAVVLALAAIGTGSRKIFVQFFIYCVLYNCLEIDIKVMLKRFSFAFIVIGLGYLILSNITLFNDIYTDRLMSIFYGLESKDGSTIVRTYYRYIAIDMFGESPIVGNGLDAFREFMGHDILFLQRWNLEGAAYSHCNQLELLANNGIIGFVLYYWIFFISFFKGIQVKENIYAQFGMTIIISTFILEYGTVSYYSVPYVFMLLIGILFVDQCTYYYKH